VIVDQINIVGVALLKPKYDPPIRPDGNAPETSKIACKTVQSEAGQIHVFRLFGAIENGEDVFNLLQLIRADALSLVVFKEPF
jgi:hypothetical protein